MKTREDSSQSAKHRAWACTARREQAASKLRGPSSQNVFKHRIDVEEKHTDRQWLCYRKNRTRREGTDRIARIHGKGRTLAQIGVAAIH